MKIIQPPRKRKDGSYESDYVACDSLKQRSKTKSQTKSQAKAQSTQFKKERNNDFCHAGKETEVVEQNDRFSANELELVPGKRRRRSELISGKAVDTDQIKQNELDPKKKEFITILQRGVYLLAMREHSVQELKQKLLAKAEQSEVVNQVMDFLIENDYVSDLRFTEAYVRSKRNKGQGPVKIRAQLKQKGVSSVMVDDALAQGDAAWFDFAKSEYEKKYRDAPVKDYNDWSKRARFLQGRGFTMDHIHCAVPQPSSD